MNKKKWIKLGLTVLLAFSLTACGTKDSGNADQSNSAVTTTAEAENAQEALSTYKKLMEQGKIEKEMRIYEFLATCDSDDLHIV
mgnify:CR=1 FL=1